MQCRWSNKALLYWSLFDCCDACIWLEGNLTITEVRVGSSTQAHEFQKITFNLKDYTLFTDCVIENSNSQFITQKFLMLGC